jgi:hypothetical protein
MSFLTRSKEHLAEQRTKSLPTHPAREHLIPPPLPGDQQRGNQPARDELPDEPDGVAELDWFES